MRSKLLKQIISTLGFVFAMNQSVFATDLLEVYYEALENDPTFKRAYSVFMAESTSIPQALAALLPQLTTDALIARTYTEVMSGPTLDVNRTYSQNRLNVYATQSLFNMKSWSILEQARANVRAALANFNDSAQNLILRSAQAYFNVLLAQDNLNTVKVQRQAYKRQLMQAQDRFNVGLDPVTTVYQAKAAYDQSQSTVITAQNNLMDAQQNLAKLTNHSYPAVAALKNKTIPLMHPEPFQSESWINTSLKQNYKLYAAKYYLETARQNIKTQFSGHLPYFTLFGNFNEVNNLVGSANPSTTGTGPVNSLFNDVFVPQRTRNANTGVSVNLPLFQGGLVVAKTKEAEFKFQDYSNQLEYIRREVVTNTQITFNAIRSGIAKVKADQQSLKSQKCSLESIEQQYQVGTKTLTDVLYAQQQYFQTQLQYTNDQYSLITQLLQLKYLAGTLNVKDLEEINSWLDTNQINSMTTRSKQILKTILTQP
jgi:outer membrane protein